MIIVRFADDVVVGFQHRSDAKQFHEDLVKRFAKFNLELNAEKTRLIEFGRFAAQNRRRHRLGRPETFSFLGFTHMCGKTRSGHFALQRKTITKRMTAKLREVNALLKQRRHWPIPEQGAVARQRGARAGPLTTPCRATSQRCRPFASRSRVLDERLPAPEPASPPDLGSNQPLETRWLPAPRISHPWPNVRFDARTQGSLPARSRLAGGICPGGRPQGRSLPGMIDLDVQKFFDTVPWSFVVKAVEAVTDCRWVLLYVKRWLAAPLQMPDGTLVEREKKTRKARRLRRSWRTCSCTSLSIPGWPGGSRDVLSRRFADDAVVHCRTRRQAEEVLAAIAERMEQVGLRLHPDKTRIHGKDGRRRGDDEHASFTFLGFTFRARKAIHKKGEMFTSFLPAMSTEALQAKSDELLRHADPSSHHHVPRRPGPMAQPHRARVDELLRPVLQIGPSSPPHPCQHLPETLGGEEVPAAAG